MITTKTHFQGDRKGRPYHTRRTGQGDRKGRPYHTPIGAVMP